MLERAYEDLYVLTPSQLAGLILSRAGAGSDPLATALSAGDRLAMLVARIDELSLQHHDFGGRPNTLLAGFIRRIDRLKAELVTPGEYWRWAQSLAAGSPAAALEHEFAEIYATHERMLAETGARDAGDLIIDAISLARRQPALAQRFTHLLLDDAQELDLAPVTLALEVGTPGLTVAGDPRAALRRFRAAGAARMASFAGPDAYMVELETGHRCPQPIGRAAAAVLGAGGGDSGELATAAPHGGEVELWRCTNERSQAQAVAVDIERLLAREGVHPGRVAVFVPEIVHEGQAVGVALEERAIAHRLVGEAASFSAPRSVTCSRGCGCSPIRPTPVPSSAPSRAHRSSCARSTSPVAPRSRAGASSTWSGRLSPRWSRPRCRLRRASASGSF